MTQDMSTFYFVTSAKSVRSCITHNYTSSRKSPEKYHILFEVLFLPLDVNNHCDTLIIIRNINFVHNFWFFKIYPYVLGVLHTINVNPYFALNMFNYVSSRMWVPFTPAYVCEIFELGLGYFHLNANNFLNFKRLLSWREGGTSGEV